MKPTIVRALKERVGATCIEVLWLLLMLAGGVVIALYAGARFGWLGYVVGFVGGTLASIGVCVGGVLLFCFVVGLFTGIPEFPHCGSGKCKDSWTNGFGDYQPEMIGDRLGLRCKCGVLYVKRGRRVFEVLPGGARRPHMVWRPFRGWRPDTEGAARDN